MNKIVKYIAGIMLMLTSVSITSCVDDLNVTPIDPSTQQVFNAIVCS